jgi:hypothetical protein
MDGCVCGVWSVPRVWCVLLVCAVGCVGVLLSCAVCMYVCMYEYVGICMGMYVYVVCYVVMLLIVLLLLC